jgi:hypothetical protein
MIDAITINAITDYMKNVNVRDAMVYGFMIIYAAGPGYFYLKDQFHLNKYNREKAKEELDKKESPPKYNTIDNHVK